MQASVLALNPDESAVLRLVLQRVGISTRLFTELDRSRDEGPTLASDLLVLAFNREIPISILTYSQA